MTRFARARGSKASNERLPEEATSWSVMKQQLEESRLKNSKDENNGNVSSNNEVFDKSKVRPNNNNVWEVFETVTSDSSASKIECITDKNQKKLSCEMKKSKKLKNKLTDNHKCIRAVIKNDSTKKYELKGNTFIVSKTVEHKESEGSPNLLNIKNNINIKKTIDDKVKNHSDFTTKYKSNIPFQDSNAHKVTRSNCFSENDIANVKNNLSGRNNSAETVKQKRVKVGVSGLYNTMNARNEDITLNVEMKHRKTSYMPQNDNSNSLQSNYRKFPLQKKEIFHKQSPYIATVGSKFIEISHFQGFAVKKEDAERLCKLKKDLLNKGVPRKEIETALQVERRRAEKALTREKKVVCFKCRKFGHNMAECPECEDPNGICFKCGSTEHSVRECRVVQNDSFKFAHCFICQDQGHIARQCPDNPRGLYPKGGACKICGDVTHLKKDCIKLINEKEKNTITLGTVHNNSIEVLDEDLKKEMNVKKSSKNRNFVKF
ncbi:uncharacterized protein LOC142332567 [Lycorma delicatula]|uniref:uncharacterized protein LOC142332567 n=1 Tax=Lycorma delicatula TaxID=130591 RepID=UPI003F510A42